MKQFRSSLRYKLGAWMLVLSLIPLAIVSAVVLTMMLDQLGAFSTRLSETENALRSDVVGRNLAGAAAEAATVIDEYMLARIQEIRRWTEDAAIIRAARRGTETAEQQELTGIDPERAQERLNVGMMVPLDEETFLAGLSFLSGQTERASSPYVEIIVTEATGLNVLITRPVEAVSHQRDGWWQAARRLDVGGIGLTPPALDPGQGVPVVGVALPILDPDSKEFLGVIRAQTSLVHLQNRLSRLARSLGADIRVFTHDGVLVAETSSGHSKARVLVDVTNLLSQGDVAAGRALAAEPGAEGAGFTRLEQPEGAQIVGYARTNANPFYRDPALLPNFDGLRWGVTIAQSEQLATAVLRRLIETATAFQRLPGRLGLIFAGVSALFAVLALGGTALVSRSITDPVIAVSKMADRVQGGDLSASVDVRSTDEAGRLSVAFNAMTAGLRERERERDVFGRAVSPEIREKLLAGRLELGGETRKVTVLFSDIRSFSTLSEQMTAHEVVTFLNEYLTEMTTAVRNAGGYLNNFIGDAVVAIFGAPADQPDQERRAVQAALEMRERLEALNRRRVERGEEPITSGIGISTGPAVAGQVGSLERLMYTVIGDAVNIAARLEALTKEHPDCPILVNRTTVAALDPVQERIDLGPLEVKGRAEPVHVFAIPSK